MVSKKPIVMLVDDDANDEELAKIALEHTDVPHQLLVKRDGAQVLEWISQIPMQESDLQLPHLVLLDLKLPKVTGLEVLEKLRANALTKNLPVVIFTSSNEERDLAQSYECGANAYIRKPIDFKEYRQTVGDMARFWILRNQSPPRAAVEGWVL